MEWLLGVIEFAVEWLGSRVATAHRPPAINTSTTPQEASPRWSGRLGLATSSSRESAMEAMENSSNITPAQGQTPTRKPHLLDCCLDLRLALRKPPPLVRHVLPGLLAGTVGLLAAPGGKGKTMLLLQLAVAMATGRPICAGLFDNLPGVVSRVTEPSRVVLLLAEESPAIATCRMHTIVSDLLQGAPDLFNAGDRDAFLDVLASNLILLPHADSGRPCLFQRNGTATALYRQLAEVSDGAALVLADPLRQLHSGDEVDSEYMTHVMSQLHKLVAGTQGAMLVAHHTSQASSVAAYGDLAQAARGSTAITDAVRCQINLSTPAEKWLADKKLQVRDRDRVLRLDVAKANNLPPIPTQLLVRERGGLLRLARRGEFAPNGMEARSLVRTSGQVPR